MLPTDTRQLYKKDTRTEGQEVCLRGLSIAVERLKATALWEALLLLPSSLSLPTVAVKRNCLYECSHMSLIAPAISRDPSKIAAVMK